MMRPKWASHPRPLLLGLPPYGVPTRAAQLLPRRSGGTMAPCFQKRCAFKYLLRLRGGSSPPLLGGALSFCPWRSNRDWPALLRLLVQRHWLALPRRLRSRCLHGTGLHLHRHSREASAWPPSLRCPKQPLPREPHMPHLPKGLSVLGGPPIPPARPAGGPGRPKASQSRPARQGTAGTVARSAAAQWLCRQASPRRRAGTKPRSAAAVKSTPARRARMNTWGPHGTFAATETASRRMHDTCVTIPLNAQGTTR